MAHRHRRGAVMIVALVTLLVVTALVAGMLRSLALRRSAAELAVWQLQAAALAESGLERAAARLAVDQDYRGETWSVSVKQRSGDAAGVVEVAVEPPRTDLSRIPGTSAGPNPSSDLATASSAWQVHVVAQYPADSHHCARQERRAAVVLPSATR
ncbi:MAG: hypothetical protein ACOY3P_25810 [Planctomycetota bacterium]